MVRSVVRANTFRDEQEAGAAQHAPFGRQHPRRTRAANRQQTADGPLSLQSIQVQKWRNQRRNRGTLSTIFIYIKLIIKKIMKYAKHEYNLQNL